jgi:hypothetical protein
VRVVMRIVGGVQATLDKFADYFAHCLSFVLFE